MFVLANFLKFNLGLHIDLRAIFIISSFATPSAVIKPLDFPALFEPTSALACAA